MKRILKTAVKILVIVVLLFFDYGIAASMLEEINDKTDRHTEGYYKESFLRYISEDEFGEVYDRLDLYRYFGEDYQPYWDICEAYHTYVCYDTAVRAYENTGDAYFLEMAQAQQQIMQELPEDYEEPTLALAIERMKGVNGDGSNVI